ncbi:hypothetical protein ACJ73_07948 [Blastomyces percursus]|uniref:Uncharacterized protein n=1 Tax=Blastomyces percursus TaxID=1658174 RepID=A0A1J9QZH6_9EURO|nr:hypothetical protein ACJ73_07948 [Blastomyces percursus]
MRKKVDGATEEERRSTKWLSYLLPSRDQEDYVLKESGVLSASETSPLQNPSSLRHLLDETSDLIDSPQFTQILTLLNNEAFSALIDNKCAIEAFKSTTPAHKTPTAQEDQQQEPQNFSSSVTLTQTTYASTSTPVSKAKLATILAVIARQAHVIGNGTEPPNDYLVAMEQGVRELEAFAAVVYSSNFFDAKLPVFGSNPEGGSCAGEPLSMAATNNANVTNDDASSQRNSPGFVATTEKGGLSEGKEDVVGVGTEESIIDLGAQPSGDHDSPTPSFEKVWGKAVEEQQQQQEECSS